jgi:galactokinase
MAYSSNVPMGSGLNSSAALEVGMSCLIILVLVGCLLRLCFCKRREWSFDFSQDLYMFGVSFQSSATARFVECFLHDGMAFSSAKNKEEDIKKTRALRCQKAENVWALSPCGIMDQFASSCCQKNHMMLLDCKNLEITQVPLKKTNDGDDDTSAAICFLICNSKVEHEIADSEYGTRRKECYDAVMTLQQVPLYHVESLRDAIVKDLDTAKEKLGEKLYMRAHHVVTEITRTKECVTALKLGLWDKVGELMTASHRSLQNDFEVSCEELDTLVDLALAQPGVYGSRMTGGGFGGCTVTLCQADCVEAIKAAIVQGYAEQYNGAKPDCFVSTPGTGACVLAIDMDCKPESEFYAR